MQIRFAHPEHNEKSHEPFINLLFGPLTDFADWLRYNAIELSRPPTGVSAEERGWAVASYKNYADTSAQT